MVLYKSGRTGLILIPRVLSLKISKRPYYIHHRSQSITGMLPDRQMKKVKRQVWVGKRGKENSKVSGVGVTPDEQPKAFCSRTIHESKATELAPHRR